MLLNLVSVKKNRQIAFEFRWFPDETLSHTHAFQPVKEGGEIGSMLKEKEQQEEAYVARLSLSLSVWASVYLPLSTSVTRPGWEAAREEEKQDDGPPDSVCVCADVSDVHHCVSALEERYDRRHLHHISALVTSDHSQRKREQLQSARLCLNAWNEFCRHTNCANKVEKHLRWKINEMSPELWMRNTVAHFVVRIHILLEINMWCPEYGSSFQFHFRIKNLSLSLFPTILARNGKIQTCSSEKTEA